MSTDAAKRLLEAASPQPWEWEEQTGVVLGPAMNSRGDRLGVLSTGGAFEPAAGYPEKREERHANAQLGALAPDLLRVAIGAVEALAARKEADSHVTFCEDCDAGALNFCMAGGELLNVAAQKDAKALAEWEKLFP